jgi:hypothetical protein
MYTTVLKSRSFQPLGDPVPEKQIHREVACNNKNAIVRHVHHPATEYTFHTASAANAIKYTK